MYVCLNPSDLVIKRAWRIYDALLQNRCASGSISVVNNGKLSFVCHTMCRLISL